MNMTRTSNFPVYSRTQLEATFLPREQMLQIDRVSAVSDAGIVCELDVPGHWVFPMHFPTDPIFPGSLLIEAAGQAVAIRGWHSGLRGRPRMARVEAKFISPVLPDDQIVTLMAAVRLRKNVCVGVVEVFVVDRKIAVIKPVIIIAA